MALDKTVEELRLKPLTKDVAEEIAQWEYETPYEAYSIKGHHDEYLMDESTWGIEQFCLVGGGAILGQVSCQYEGDDLWVGWSMAPQFCGKGNGAAFVGRCVEELCRVKDIMDECFFVFRPAIKEQLKPTKRLVSDIWKPYRMKLPIPTVSKTFG